MNTKRLFGDYIKSIAETALRGDAREESFYPALEEMLKTVAVQSGREQVAVTTQPSPTEAGNPDFRLWNGTDRIIGYVEAKRPTEERLDLIEDSEQLTRYRATFPNLVLTNFLEFRLYRNGVLVDTVLAARPMILQRVRTVPPMEKPDELYALLERFLEFSQPKAFTAEVLAVELAKRTRFLRDVTGLRLAAEKGDPGMLAGFFEAFQTYLIGTLTPEDFADLFAQTIAYGLFAARTRAGNNGPRFNRRAAFDNIPQTIGVLRNLFRFISLGDLPEELAWCVDDIAEVLAVADTPGILDRYYHEGKGSDPIVHFYETFLARYDPEERERRGVYYTPEPVVGYIVRSLHALLKTEFDKQDGLASEGVTLLDPAAGTMTFVARAAQQAVAEFESKYGSGGTEDFIRRHILKNFFAFELMMAPYAVGHLKMSFFLEEMGHRLADGERMPFYLTNTLDYVELEQSRLPGFAALAQESRLAGRVKKSVKVLVILGNPPYSGISTNKGEWISGLIEDYKYVDGEHFGEKKHWLQDDYVKFLRFAQWKIEQAGCGVVGMITNHGYLDNPTFRGMRQSLMQTFDDIFILDLHGNSLKKEVCPDGSPDHNVFDIRQGVAVAFFIKRGPKGKGHAVVKHAELWGARDEKYAWLNSHELRSTDWMKLTPSSPFYFFVHRDEKLAAAYQRYPAIPDIFPVNSVGIVTARDKLTVHWTSEAVWKTVLAFSKMDAELARTAYNLGKDVQSWKVSWAQEDILLSGPTQENVTKILYRPFDVRHTYYTGKSNGFLARPAANVMGHMLEGENLALLTPKRVEHAGDWRHAFVANTISEHVAVSLKTTDYHFPLFIYYSNGNSRNNRKNMFGAERRPNLNPDLVAALAKAHGREPAPEDVFHYVYAVLYAPAYREKYAEFLRMDFPRIPFPTDPDLFSGLAALGRRLVALHLLRSPELDPPSCRFDGQGDGRVGKGRAGLRYEPDETRAYVNPQQYFSPVPDEVWNFRVGGYQVCEKWLKDRRERRLELEDIRVYCRVVSALGLTLQIQKEIDPLFEQVDAKLLTGIPQPKYGSSPKIT